ncbi:hypothetical protein AGMMS50268_11140 [Spirochaetia bacterium]|nr:hypothetical protein AGMMS50268_11140 [Spirochaetia bacterium]
MKEKEKVTGELSLTLAARGKKGLGNAIGSDVSEQNGCVQELGG